MLIVKKIRPKPDNDGASAKASPFHALMVLEENDCPYVLASCMINLSEFHIVFSSSAFIRLNKDAFEWHYAKPLIIL